MRGCAAILSLLLSFHAFPQCPYSRTATIPFRSTAYDVAVDVVPGVRATFVDAGHILGSSSVILDCTSGATTTRLVFSGDLPLEQLISHRVPLAEIERGISLCRRPGAESLKVVVHPQEQSRWQ